MSFPATVLSLIAAVAGAADNVVSAASDPLAGLPCLDAATLAGATGGFRLGNLEIGIGAVIRTQIADGTAAGADGGFARVDAYPLEPGMRAAVSRLDLSGTTVTGIGLAGIIENAHPNRTISRQVTLNVEIAGLASAVRAAAAGRAISAAGPAPRFR